MEMTFRFPVFKQLVWRDIWISRQSTLILLGVICGFLALAGLISINSVDFTATSNSYHTIWYGILFLIIGVVQTGGIFKEFNRPATLQDYLLLPASHLEKWLSRWFRSLVLYILLFTIGYSIAATLLHVIVYIIRDVWIPLYNPINTEVFGYWKVFIILHAVFLIGAVHFNKNAALKTAFTIFLVAMVFSIITGIVQYLLMKSLMSEGQLDPETLSMDFDPAVWFSNYKTILDVLLWLVLIPFFWWVSFLKLNEKEV